MAEDWRAAAINWCGSTAKWYILIIRLGLLRRVMVASWLGGMSPANWTFGDTPSICAHDRTRQDKSRFIRYSTRLISSLDKIQHCTRPCDQYPAINTTPHQSSLPRPLLRAADWMPSQFYPGSSKRHSAVHTKLISSNGPNERVALIITPSPFAAAPPPRGLHTLAKLSL